MESKKLRIPCPAKVGDLVMCEHLSGLSEEVVTNLFGKPVQVRRIYKDYYTGELKFEISVAHPRAKDEFLCLWAWRFRPTDPDSVFKYYCDRLERAIYDL